MTSDVDDQVEWPTHCSHCGTALESEVVESIVPTDWNEGSPVPVLAVDVCPNPDCPGKQADPAGTASPDGAQP
jgi:hypothetical protein